jgi:hypothetical protein
MQLEESEWGKYVRKAAGENAVRFDEVVQFMHLQTPRVLPQGLLKPVFSKGLLIVGLVLIPAGLDGLFLATLALFAMDDMRTFYWGVALATPALIMLIVLYSRRNNHREIVEHGSFATATIHNLSEDRGMPALTASYPFEVHFQGGGEQLCRAGKVKGMQVMLLRKCVDAGEEMPLLYLRHDPHQFLLAVQLTSWKVPSRLLMLFRYLRIND